MGLQPTHQLLGLRLQLGLAAARLSRLALRLVGLLLQALHLWLNGEQRCAREGRRGEKCKAWTGMGRACQQQQLLQVRPHGMLPVAGLETHCLRLQQCFQTCLWVPPQAELQQLRLPEQAGSTQQAPLPACPTALPLTSALFFWASRASAAASAATDLACSSCSGGPPPLNHFSPAHFTSAQAWCSRIAH